MSENNEKQLKFDDYLYLFRYSSIKKSEAEKIWPYLKESVTNLFQARELFFATRKIIDSKKEEAWVVVREYAKKSDFLTLLSLFSAIHGNPENEEIWCWLKESAKSSQKLFFIYDLVKNENKKRKNEVFKLLVAEAEGLEDVLALLQLEPTSKELSWDLLRGKIQSVEDCAKILSLDCLALERAEVLGVTKEKIKNLTDFKVLYNKKGALKNQEKSRLSKFLSNRESQEEIDDLWSFVFEGSPEALQKLRQKSFK